LLFQGDSLRRENSFEEEHPDDSELLASAIIDQYEEYKGDVSAYKEDEKKEFEILRTKELDFDAALEEIDQDSDDDRDSEEGLKV
jgi:hypothetical protein